MAEAVVILAGFMRILTADFVDKWQGKMLNIHPSLLLPIKALIHQRIKYGDRLHGHRSLCDF